MSVSSPFIRRPIATSLLGIAVMLGGALGYWWLPVSALPQVDFPTIQVTTQLPGANPDTIASLVTAPLERQFGQIPALATMHSSSSFGISQVTLQSDLTGVGHVSVQGGLRPAVRIQADLSRLAAYGIGLEDLRTAIVGANVAGAKGSFDGTHQSYTIAANDQVTDINVYKAVVVAYRNGAPVLLSDVADVLEGLENTKVGAWYGGDQAVVVDVQRQPGANVIDTVSLVRAELPRLQRTMPVGVKLTIV